MRAFLLSPSGVLDGLAERPALGILVSLVTAVSQSSLWGHPE